MCICQINEARADIIMILSELTIPNNISWNKGTARPNYIFYGGNLKSHEMQAGLITTLNQRSVCTVRYHSQTWCTYVCWSRFFCEVLCVCVLLIYSVIIDLWGRLYEWSNATSQLLPSFLTHIYSRASLSFSKPLLPHTLIAHLLYLPTHISISTPFFSYYSHISSLTPLLIFFLIHTRPFPHFLLPPPKYILPQPPLHLSSFSPLFPQAGPDKPAEFTLVTFVFSPIVTHDLRRPRKGDSCSQDTKKIFIELLLNCYCSQTKKRYRYIRRQCVSIFSWILNIALVHINLISVIVLNYKVSSTKAKMPEGTNKILHGSENSTFRIWINATGYPKPALSFLQLLSSSGLGVATHDVQST